MTLHGVFVAHTHRTWFDNLSRLATRSGSGALRIDEVNFWAPKSTAPIKTFVPGEPIFFRLGAPDRAIAGYGFYADHLESIDVYLAWRLFGRKNGADTLGELARLLQRPNEQAMRRPVGSMILRDATFWPESRWIPWGIGRGYARSGIQRGRTDANPENVALLLAQLRRDAVARPDDLAEDFKVVTLDERRWVEAERVQRAGQGTFRARLLKAYGGQCAVTGEHTEPVLDAAHIQPYLGPASNHVQNGLLLTKEFHTLFDEGLVCVEQRGDDYRLRVSRLLQELWNNGRRYREYDEQTLHVPDDPRLRPSADALAWHREERYERVA